MDANASLNYIHAFREAAPYIYAHRDRTFVLALPGEALADANLPNIVHDLALLSSLDVRLVIVHGCRPQVDRYLAEQGREAPVLHDLRVTDSATLEVVRAISGSLRSQLEALFSMGLPDSPMHGMRLRTASGNFITARPVGVRHGIDYQFTGEVRRVDIDGIRQQLAQNAIVILSPIGYSVTGESFNLGLEATAVAVARTLKADKLIALVDDDGLRGPQGELVREVTTADLAGLPENALWDIPTLASVTAQGVDRCHLVSYRQDGALLTELFRRDGSGTLITATPYERIRAATIEDIGGIVGLIEPLERDGVLVRRSRERLETEVEHFTVAERDGVVVGCAALYPYAGNGSGEIACVVTHPEYRGHGRALALLQHLEKQARQIGLQSVFVLTTQTAHWFREQGFQPVSLDSLPPEKQALYNYQRNSQVFSKRLG